MAVPIDGLTTRVLLQHQRTTTTQVRDRVLNYVTAVWAGLGSWRDTDIERFVSAVVPVVLAGQKQVSALTDAYLAQVAAQKLGKTVQPLGVTTAAVTGAAVRNGVEPAVVYVRPFMEMRTALGEGVAFTEALKRGTDRLVSLASTDLQRTKQLTAREVVSRSGATGYLRVPGGVKTCALCWIASTQRYHKRDLLPIHPGCSCEVDPYYGPDVHVVDPATLEAVHDAVEAQFGFSDRGGREADYRKLIAVREHGELGQVLTVAGHHFTGPEAIKSGLDLSGLTRI